jgi:ABC-type multidrug transport system fused ATPase/permease subunit
MFVTNHGKVNPMKFQINNSSTLASSMFRLWEHISKKRRWQLVILLLLIILASFAEMLSIGAVLPFLGVLTNPESVYRQPFLQPVITFLEIKTPKDLLFPIALLFGFTIVFANLTRFMLLWANTRLSFGVGFDLGLRAYQRALYQPYSYHVSNNSSNIIATIGKATNIVMSTLLPILNILSSVIMLLGVLVMLVLINPYVAFAIFGGVGLIYILIIKYANARLMRSSQTVSTQVAKSSKLLHEGLGGIRDILIDGNQEVFCKLYASADLPARYSAGTNALISASPHYGIESLAMLLIISISYILATQDGGIIAAIPTLGALALGAQRLMPILQKIYASWADIKGSEASLLESLDLLDKPMPNYAGKVIPKVSFERHLRLDNISFKYDSNETLVLKGISLVIKKGEKVGFIGKTGCGKSTLLDVLMGLLQPIDGSILIDDVSMDVDNARGWQAHLAHVPQAIFLADISVKENIAFGVPSGEIDFERVKMCAQKAQIAQYIEKWPQGYETQVGERGVRLSGGQRQRIGLARALYKNADVIILDEATSALDGETEDLVMEEVNGLRSVDGSDLTILMIAHRLSTLKSCNKIVLIEDGRIKSVGSYAELIGSPRQT